MSNDRTFKIAIDGPSGAGKSTFAKMIAKELGFIYVDTGAIYRTVGYFVHSKGIGSTDKEQVISVLPQIKIELTYNNSGQQRMILCGEDISDFIRTPVISKYASDVSAMPEVRAFLLNMQRDLAEKYNVVMDGRDIGTVIMPDAQVKIFLTASAEVRAERRWLELKEKGIDITLQQVLEDQLSRDANDSSRDTAPLKAAEDSITVDSSSMTIEQTKEKLISVIREKLQI